MQPDRCLHDLRRRPDLIWKNASTAEHFGNAQSMQWLRQCIVKRAQSPGALALNNQYRMFSKEHSAQRLNTLGQRSSASRAASDVVASKGVEL